MKFTHIYPSPASPTKHKAIMWPLKAKIEKPFLGPFLTPYTLKKLFILTFNFFFMNFCMTHPNRGCLTSFSKFRKTRFLDPDEPGRDLKFFTYNKSCMNNNFFSIIFFTWPLGMVIGPKKSSRLVI